MMKKFSLILLLGAFALVSYSGCGSFKRFMYEGPGRDDWQKPEEVVAALELAPGDVVADLGSGGGYFTYPMAEAVGASGHVYALDVDESLLAYIASQSEKRGLLQVETILAPEDGLGLPDGSVDLIFLSNVYHHLPDPVTYFRKARATLRPGGRIAVVEFVGNSFPRNHATLPTLIRSNLESAGYAVAAQHEFLEKQSFQIFIVEGVEGVEADAAGDERAAGDTDSR
jgi:arsenite methyltransferase